MNSSLPSAEIGLTQSRHPMLSIRKLTCEFPIRGRDVLRALDDAQLDVEEGEAHGLVGESGSGKSVLALSILGLIEPPGRIVKGSILWRDRNLLAMPERDLNAVRGRGVAMVFQDAPASLNPALRIGRQLRGILTFRRQMSRAQSRLEALRLLDSVHLPDPQRILASYAHELSGGMAQRVAIAMALACQPALLVADEPTSALDVTTAAQFLLLLEELRDSMKLSILLISHDLRVVYRLCDKVSIICAGRIVEHGPRGSVLHNPLHPYTQTLLQSLDFKVAPKNPLTQHCADGQTDARSGNVNSCIFAPRCPKAFDRCHRERPLLQEQQGFRAVACWLYE